MVIAYTDMRERREAELAARERDVAQARAEELRSLAVELATSGVAELRRLAAGIHPAVLTDRGLKPAIESLAERLPLPVSVHGEPAERLPAAVEASVYFFVSEALTNVVKHAKAEDTTVRLGGAKDCLTVEVRDDGVGGAQVSDGSGLPGLDDRIAALDGTLEIRSPPGGGTLLRARIPLP